MSHVSHLLIDESLGPLTMCSTSQCYHPNYILFYIPIYIQYIPARRRWY